MRDKAPSRQVSLPQHALREVQPTGLYWDDPLIFDIGFFGARILDLPGFTSRMGNFTAIQEWRHTLIINGFPDPFFPQREQKANPKGDIGIKFTWHKCAKGSSLLNINGNSIQRTESGGASIKLDEGAAFFFGLYASRDAGREITVKPDTVIALDRLPTGGYEISASSAVSIGFRGPNVNIRNVQFNSEGRATKVDATYLGFGSPISNIVRGQVNDALAATFGTGKGMHTTVVEKLLDTVNKNESGLCFDVFISPPQPTRAQ